MNGNRKEDSGLKAKVNEEIIEESNKLNEYWWDMDLVSRKSTAASISLARGHNFFLYGHRCGAYHNASDAQVRNKRMQYAKVK